LKEPHPIRKDEKLVGVGGWLLLLIIKLWAGAAIRLVAAVGGPNLVGLVNLVFAVVSATAAYLLGRKNPRGVALAKVALAAEAIYYALELVPPMSVANPSKTAGFLAASVLYFAYLFRSKRVKNTYFKVGAISSSPVRNAPAPTKEAGAR
jgi:hypothetical protein